jgi:tetratricopeptide (TPR) repeat protein
MFTLNSYESISKSIYSKIDSLDDALVSKHNYLFKEKKFETAADVMKELIIHRSRSNVIRSNDFYLLGIDFYLSASFKPNFKEIINPERIKFVYKADSCFVKAIEINSKWPPFYLYRARANNLIVSTKNISKSAEYYEKFLETIDILKSTSNSQYKDDHNHLFEAYKFLGSFHLMNTHNEEKVNSYFKKAFEINPNDSELKEYFNSK